MKRAGTLLLLLACASAHAEGGADPVIHCMRANVPPQLSIGMVELTMYDRTGGARTVKGHIYSARDKSPKGLMSAMLRVDSPSDLKGASYLVRETDDYLRDGMFVYLPGVKRVRRVTGSFADGSLLGTNFSYFDFKQMQNAFGDLAAKLEPAEEVNGRAVHVLSFSALPGTETRYTNVKAWIDQKACIGVKAQFFEGNKLVKELSSPPDALHQAGDTWYLHEMEMRDPISGTRTVLRMGQLNTSKAPPRQAFDPTAFYLAP
jgi:hypothetical protein